MPRKPKRPTRLTDRDYEILEHVMRYRLTTREVLHRLFFSDSEVNAVSKVTSRLVASNYLAEWEIGLTDARKYFTIGKAAASFLGVSPKKSAALGPQAFAIEYAVLCYCCLREETRERLTVSELHARQPRLVVGKVDNSHYCLDHDGHGAVLTYLRVELGGAVDHVMRKCRRDVESRRKHEIYTELMNAGRFGITVITGSQKKADLIFTAMRRAVDLPARLTAVSVPQLAEVIARLRYE